MTSHNCVCKTCGNEFDYPPSQRLALEAQVERLHKNLKAAITMTEDDLPSAIIESLLSDNEGLEQKLEEATGVIKFCRNANPHPDLSYHKYNAAIAQDKAEYERCGNEAHETVDRLIASRKTLAEMNDEKHRTICGLTGGVTSLQAQLAEAVGVIEGYLKADGFGSEDCPEWERQARAFLAKQKEQS